MLTFLFALAAIWTLFWLVMYMLDWGDRTPFTDSNALCATCAKAMSGAMSGNSAGAKASAKGVSGSAAKASSGYTAKSGQNATGKSGTTNTANTTAQATKQSEADASVKAAREEARKQAAKQANANSQNNAVKKPVADKHDQANVKPLFVAPNEKDDLKIIKGIGVVMEKTLNDLGITTFKQLAGFKQTDVKMVSEALDASNSGFGDRIERDEWVDQAKVLAKKAS